jgi:maltooligosyltrehalose trehalohydrolase
MTSPFTPMLFMGEEFAASTPWQFFTSHPEPELGKATAEGRIKEFERMGWDPAVVPDPQDPETFLRSKLKWNETGQGEHARLLQLYKDLAQLRRNTPDLVDGGFGETSVEFDDDEHWLQFTRGHRPGGLQLRGRSTGDALEGLRVAGHRRRSSPGGRNPVASRR